MVLKTAAAVAPKFEDMDDAPEASVAAPAPAAVTQLPVARTTSTAIAKPAPVNMADFDILAALENRLPPVGYGEGTRLVGSNGNVMDGDGRVLGDTVVLRLISWNNRWVISPGGQGQESREFARFSMDGVTTSQGENVQEYLRQLKEDGFDKAALKVYVDLFGLLESAAKPTDHLNKSVTVSLSPDSVKAFMGLRRDIVVQGLTGQLAEVPDPNRGLRLKITTEIKSANGMNWTRLVTSLA